MMIIHLIIPKISIQ